jgi:hypothetical protein
MALKSLGVATTLCLLIISVQNQCCLQFSGELCLKCPKGMHLYRGNCLFDLPNCLEYAQGFDCQRCKGSYTLSGGRCLHQSKR